MTHKVEPISHRNVKVLDYFSAGAAYLAIFFIRMLPFAWASNLGGFLASCLGPFLKKSNVARKNLKAAFPEKSEAEIEAIVREVWSTLGRAGFEFAIMDRLLKGKDRNRVEIEGEENLQAALETGQPVLFFGAHFGSWELIPMSTLLLDFKAHTFYRAPNNPLLLKLFTARNIRGEAIPKGNPGARRAMRLLKKGQNLGLLVDQKLNTGIPVPLFGRDAMTGTALAEFALRFDAPMVPIRCTRLPGARFKMSILPALNITKTGSRKDDIKTIMTDVNVMLESWITQHPGQWLWLHNRWPD
ncbi:MAG: lauroyl acyltransferase [Magnetovibrio sp.]|nr:lauroyl acyltransferase [Magnetovibrio sp.]